MADRLTAMEVFVRAIRLGGLSAAARDLHMSPAMAAKHVDALEARLGTTLMHRTTRRLSLTEAGADYLDKAERILLDIGEAEADASSRSIAVEGLLRISAPTTFGVMFIAPLVPEFHALHPGVTLKVGFNDRYVDLLEERWDMAIRIGQLADSSLIARRLAPMHLVLCASPAYLADRGTPTRLADLSDHDCLGHGDTTQTGASTWHFGAEGEISVPVRGTMHANNGEALVRAATAGQGLVYGPRFIAAAALADGSLVEVPLDAVPKALGGLYAITHPTRLPAAKTRAWIDFLVARLPAMATQW